MIGGKEPRNRQPGRPWRDIAAEVDHVDVDGARHAETWFVDCKHYERGVPPEALQGLLAWAQAERPHVALVIASGFLSNAAKDYLRDYEQNNRPPFRIKYWERPTVNELAWQNPELLARFFTSGTPWYPTDAEHIMQCELAGCKHPAVYVIDGDPLTQCLAGARFAVPSPGNRRKSLRNLAPARNGYARWLKSPHRVGAAPARYATLAQQLVTCRNSR